VKQINHVTYYTIKSYVSLSGNFENVFLLQSELQTCLLCISVCWICSNFVCQFAQLLNNQFLSVCKFQELFSVASVTCW